MLRWYQRIDWPMLVAVVLLFVFGVLIGQSRADAAQHWHTNYAAATSESAATGKPLFIFCTRTGCGPCLTVQHVFNGEPAALSRCVLLRLKDETTYTPQLGVTRFPSLLLYGADGGYLWSHVGAIPGVELRERIASVTPQMIGDDDPHALANGVDVSKMLNAGPAAYKHSSGRQLSQAEAYAMVTAPGIPDDAKKFRLTITGGTAEQRTRVVRDWLAAGDLADIRERTATWNVRPDHPLIARFGFATAGSPTVYFQAPPDAEGHAGPVLHRADDYSGPIDFQAIRKAAADYDAKRDPDRRKADPVTLPPASQLALPILTLGVVLGGLCFVSKRKG